MKTMPKSKVLVMCSLLLFLSACSQVAITGRQQLNLVPDSVMNSMSFQSYAEFLSQSKLSADARQTQMVRQVGTRIQKAVEQYSAANNLSHLLQGYQWDFNLVEDPNVNAWAMPGGKVVVYTGLLPVAQNDAGLSVVLGHEIAHAFAKHGAERMSQGLLVEFGGMALSQALAKSPTGTKDLFMRSYGIGTQVGILLPYSRVQESEADRLGLIFMAMAGYNPNEAVSFWQRMSASQKGPRPPEILSTHPADSTRIRNIQELIPEAMQYYRPQ
ncbi:MAG TPA: M48 family metallopeptidase [Sedimentisphaerales bacterium]|nr:M48 family metallopeptidase [Sedimentisphaerales bacterium]